MKWMLITAILANPVTYNSEDICRQALTEVSKQDESAICIPAGETNEDQFFINFFDLVQKSKEIEQKEVDKKVN